MELRPFVEGRKEVVADQSRPCRLTQAAATVGRILHDNILLLRQGIESGQPFAPALKGAALIMHTRK
jgi:hypothetical protein